MAEKNEQLAEGNNEPQLSTSNSIDIECTIFGQDIAKYGMIMFMQQVFAITNINNEICQWRVVVGVKQTMHDDELKVDVFETDLSKIPLHIKIFNEESGSIECDIQWFTQEKSEWITEVVNKGKWKLASPISVHHLPNCMQCFVSASDSAEETMKKKIDIIKQVFAQTDAKYRASALNLVKRCIPNAAEVKNGELTVEEAIAQLEEGIVQAGGYNNPAYWSELYDSLKTDFPDVVSTIQEIESRSLRDFEKMKESLSNAVTEFDSQLVEKTLVYKQFFVIADINVEEEGENNFMHLAPCNSKLLEDYNIAEIKWKYDPRQDMELTRNWISKIKDDKDMETIIAVNDEVRRRLPHHNLVNFMIYGLESKSDDVDDTLFFPHHFAFTCLVNSYDPSTTPCQEVGMELIMEVFDDCSNQDFTELTFPLPKTIQVDIPWIENAVKNGIFKYNSEKTNYSLNYLLDTEGEYSSRLAECRIQYETYSSENEWDINVHVQPYVQYSAAFGLDTPMVRDDKGSVLIPSTVVPSPNEIAQKFKDILAESDDWKTLSERLSADKESEGKQERPEQGEEVEKREQTVQPIAIHGMIVTLVGKNILFDSSDYKKRRKQFDMNRAVDRMGIKDNGDDLKELSLEDFIMEEIRRKQKFALFCHQQNSVD